MAHGGGGDDNPVHLNVAPMVDIIFCLCIFFMCSFHFKQLEGKIESWLPKGKGPDSTEVKDPILEEVRVFMKQDTTTGETIRRVNSRVVGSDEELGDLMAEGIAKFVSRGKDETPVIIDADTEVPWSAVIRVMDICKKRGLAKVELAAPWPLK